MTNCTNILASATGQAEALMSACLQAEATIHAARIQATAARQAGTMGLVAGILTVLAAFLAAGIAYWSVHKQIRVSQDQERARAVAYRHYLVIMAMKAQHDAVLFQGWFDKNTIGWDLLYGIVKNSTVEKLWAEVNPENWANHSLLRTRDMMAIINLWDSLTHFFRVIERRNSEYMEYVDYKDKERMSIFRSSEGLDLLERRDKAEQSFINSYDYLFGMCGVAIEKIKSFKDTLNESDTFVENNPAVAADPNVPDERPAPTT